MKAALYTLLIWLSTLSIASASWEITESKELVALGRGAGVREVTLSSAGQTALLTSIVFNEKSHTLRVVDSPIPGQTTIARVLPEAGCIAGVNGGYFHADFRPVGLVVANGKRLHDFEKAKLLSGVLTVRTGGMSIVRSENFKFGRNLREAIQCGPMLVENGAVVAGLNKERVARRTVVATDSRGNWALIYLTSVSLADAAKILTVPGVLDHWIPRTALNLDGGSSSGLWAANSSATISLPEFKHVRNYIGLIGR